MFVLISMTCHNVFIPLPPSDDRSVEVFSQKIEAATQMSTMLAVDNKPNCLIIDEIDGAPTVCVVM